MITVQLIDVRIDAGHGVYQGEEDLGNPYIVNLDVMYEESGRNPHRLDNTVDYVRLHEIVQASMQVPSKLLEKLCDLIVSDVHRQYPFVKEISLSIQKLQAPIRNFNGRVGVTMHKKFDE